MEILLVNEYLNELKNEWHIYPEVWGKSIISGKTKRIDAVIISKANPNIKFGIEFKRLDLSSFTNFTSWFKQALTYTQCEWGTIGRIPILIAPKIDYRGNKEINFMMSRLLGEFGMGEISKEFYQFYNKNVYKILLKDTTIWSSESGFNKNAIKMDFQKYLDL